MKILVTGASGFLGSHVAEGLAARGDSVRCLVRKSSTTKHLVDLGVELVYGAVDDAESLPDAMRGVDAVVHCAGIVKARNQEEYDKVNAGGTRNLLEAAVAHAKGLKRFVHVSSAGVMGACQPGKRHSRDAEPNPSTMYSRSKLRSEEHVRQFADKLPITVIRPPAIYGPRDAEILAFFKMVSYGLAVRITDYKAMAMVYGPDAAKACIRAIDKDVRSGSVYFLSDGNAYTFDQMADAISVALGVETWARPSVPRFVLEVAAGITERFGKATNTAVMFNRDKVNELAIEHFDVDIAPTIEELGWKPEVTFAEGAKTTAEWYRKNGWV